MSVLFVSDLHVSKDTPGIEALFLGFLAGRARSAESLYILGDLFEYWAGDEDLASPLNGRIAAALRELSDSGTNVAFLQGNRDFLVGERFAAAAGLRLLPDPYQIDLEGRRVLLTHGDALCTDDVEYQNFRSQVRAPDWIARFLALTLEERHAQIERLRLLSETAKQRKDAYLMDVNEVATEALLKRYGYPTIIHGHTHRPAIHHHRVDQHECERWVLSDWSETRGECLVWDGRQLVRETVTAAADGPDIGRS